MAFLKLCYFLLLLFSFFLSPHLLQGFRTRFRLPLQQGLHVYPYPPLHLQATHGSKEETENRNSRRLMIGSTAPTCTYNECRGCKYKCRAEQVPVEGNDPINSAYHYKCVCHRYLGLLLCRTETKEEAGMVMRKEGCVDPFSHYLEQASPTNIWENSFVSQPIWARVMNSSIVQQSKPKTSLQFALDSLLQTQNKTSHGSIEE